MPAKASLTVKQWLIEVVVITIKYKRALRSGKFCKTLKKCRGIRKKVQHVEKANMYCLSSVTFANREVTSKEHIISLPCFAYDLAQFAKLNISSTVCWLMEIG